jgi:hypothetical protein
MAITYNIWYGFDVKIPKPKKTQAIIYLTKNNKVTQFKETAKAEHIERWNLTHWMIIKLPEKMPDVPEQPTQQSVPDTVKKINNV